MLDNVPRYLNMFQTCRYPSLIMLIFRQLGGIRITMHVSFTRLINYFGEVRLASWFFLEQTLADINKFGFRTDPTSLVVPKYCQLVLCLWWFLCPLMHFFMFTSSQKRIRRPYLITSYVAISWKSTGHCFFNKFFWGRSVFRLRKIVLGFIGCLLF